MDDSDLVGKPAAIYIAMSWENGVLESQALIIYHVDGTATGYLWKFFSESIEHGRNPHERSKPACIESMGTVGDIASENKFFVG